MKKLFALLIIFQLLSCGGINVSDIPLENVAEHRILIRDNIEDKEALEKAYVELSVENDQVWESPYIYYYLELIYDDEYESLFDLDPLESGLALFPNDPFLNNMKVNMDDNLDSSLEGYKNILENHPRFYNAVVNIDIIYRNYWNSIEDDKDIISEKERVQNLLEVVNLYESGDNNTSVYYNFNEIFSDTIAYNYLPFDTIKSIFGGPAVSIKAAEERERERIREERERIIRERNNGFIGPTKIYFECGAMFGCVPQVIAEKVIIKMRQDKYNPFGFEFIGEFEDEYGNTKYLTVGKRVIPTRGYHNEVNKFRRGSDIYDIGYFQQGTASQKGSRVFRKLLMCMGEDSRGRMIELDYFEYPYNERCVVDL